MKMKRIIALVLLTVMTVTALSSCGLTPDAMILKADKALRENPYSITSDIEYITENEELNALFTQMDMSEVVTYVDGDNIKTSISISVMGFEAGYNCVLVDNVLYNTATVGGMSATKLKATLTEEEIDEFIDGSGSSELVSADDFAKLELKKDGNTYTIIGKDAANDYLDEALADVEEQLEALDFDVTIDRADLEMVLEDEKYKTVTIVFTCTFSSGNDSYTVTIKNTNEFAYGDEYAVSAPADADKYIDVDYDEIFGNIG